jgi:hypothetical protein
MAGAKKTSHGNHADTEKNEIEAENSTALSVRFGMCTPGRAASYKGYESVLCPFLVEPFFQYKTPGRGHMLEVAGLRIQWQIGDP